MRDGPLLELRGIAVSYDGRVPSGHHDVLSDLSLRCSAGDLLCIQGRSGAGKTTLLNVAAGMVRPRKGTVLWQDESVWDHAESWRRSERRRLFGYVMQGGGLIDSLTALENVALAGFAHRAGPARQQAAGLLDGFGLESLADRFPYELSGGEQQRVALARALFGDPPMLLIDEPTASLDRATADDVMKAIAGLANDGRGIVVASHDAHVIELAQHHLVLD